MSEVYTFCRDPLANIVYMPMPCEDNDLHKHEQRLHMCTHTYIRMYVRNYKHGNDGIPYTVAQC